MQHTYRNSPPRIAFDLSRNELHLGPLPNVQEILESSAATLNRYPTIDGVARLTEQIGALHGIPAAQVVVGAGSVGVLDAVLHARSQINASTVFGTPTFDEYHALVSRAGGICAPVPSDPPGTQSLDAILSRVDASTRQVIIAAPHNPTGAAVSVDELVRFRRALPEPTLLIVDQAYAEFDSTTTPDSLRQLVAGLDGVVVLRSFSKAYGLAGLRIGYGVFSSAVLAAQVRASVPTFSVSSVALCAAEVSLQHPEQLQDRVADVIANRRRLEAFLVRQDLFSGRESEGNFVWLPTPDAELLFQHALGGRILLKEYRGLGVRITVQSSASVSAVTSNLAKLLAQGRVYSFHA